MPVTPDFAAHRRRLLENLPENEALLLFGAPERLRNGVQVNPSHHQPACKRVAQIVPAEILNARFD